MRSGACPAIANREKPLRMISSAELHSGADMSKDARDWVRILANYRDPNTGRSIFEIVVTIGPFFLLWGLALWALSFSAWLAFGIALLNGFFLCRVFLIQHDCGHGSFFRSKRVNDWVGRAIGILTLTPYDVWRKSHATHHADTGNLDRRGVGDIYTMTVKEYRAQSWFGRLRYRLYRHPLVMFGIGPSYTFLLENRLPVGYMREGWLYWVSAMGTNIATALFLAVVYYIGGWIALVAIFLPSVIMAASIGVWLFFVQHQFEDTHWAPEEGWQVHNAALHGSSHYDLPPVLRWLTANIGIHHVHHLYSRIPFYRLSEVLRDHTELAESQRLTIRESLGCVGLNLWDEDERRLVSFKSVARRNSAA